MQNLYRDLEHALLDEPSFMAEGKIVKAKVVEGALNVDSKLVRCLLGAPSLTRQFFSEVGGALVFDKERFVAFVGNKAFLPDSFTAYEGFIGLLNRRAPLCQSSDVVLAWPGRQSAPSPGPRPLAWHALVAFEDKTRLLDEAKVLTDLGRWDADAVKHGAPKPVDEIGPRENLMIHGDSLLAVASLQKKVKGAVKLAYLDAPGFAPEGNVSRPTWLTFMMNRLKAAKELLTRDGTVMIHVAQAQLAHLKILCDQVLERANFLNIFIVQKPFAVPGDGTPDTETGFVLLYARDRGHYRYQIKYVASRYDKAYSQFIPNIKAPCAQWSPVGLPAHVARLHGFKDTQQANQKLGKAAFASVVAAFAMENRHAVFQATAIHDKAGANIVAAREKSRTEPDVTLRVATTKGEVFVRKNKQVYFYAQKVREVDGELTPSKPLTNLWMDLRGDDSAEAAGVRPQRLLRRIIEIGTEPGDLVLDLFGGSDLAKVAHTLGRRWIMIEPDAARVESATDGLKQVIGSGGSFVYAALRANYYALLNQVLQAQDREGLNRMYAKIKSEGRLRYYADLTAPGLDGFDQLPLEACKAALIGCLDCNHLYVNVEDMDDEIYGVSEQERCVNRAFYAG